MILKLVTRFMRSLMCRVQGHAYASAVEVQTWRTATGRHAYKEFRAKCARCGGITQWMRWKHFDEFYSSYIDNSHIANTTLIKVKEASK